MLPQSLKRRSAIGAIGVSAVLFLGTVAIPALGGPTALSAASALKTAKKALRTAKKADKRARKADKRSKTALKEAENQQVGPRGPQGIKGDTGATGAPGAVRAYGVIKSDGTVVTARSKNVTSSKVGGGNGVYCVTPTAASGIDPTKTAMIATPDYNDGTGTHHIIQSVLATQATQPTDCPGGFEVATDELTDGSGVFTRENIAFSFVIP